MYFLFVVYFNNIIISPNITILRYATIFDVFSIVIVFLENDPCSAGNRVGASLPQVAPPGGSTLTDRAVSGTAHCHLSAVCLCQLPIPDHHICPCRCPHN